MRHLEYLKAITHGVPLAQALGFSEADVQKIAGLAAALCQTGRWAAALKLWGGLVSLQPERAEFWSALGSTLTRMGRHEEAIPVLTLTLRMDPTDTAALVNRAECYIATAQLEAAVADLERAIRQDMAETDPVADRARQLVYALHEFFRRAHLSG
ncbi:MAG: tetratricopeptide repeat protein [Acidobacteria bacterium]|nr:tetratricopeptide repeat protein [Acidobacteriota bacterium]MDW7983093.1 tetratricopeptide repeat protein [Acidobacteriota bacterium]